MGQFLDSEIVDLTPAERRWARFDRAAGVILISLGSVCLGIALLGFVSRVAGNLVHPDSVLLPLFAAIPLGGGGALLLLAGSAMRRRLPGRWTVQWGALLAPLVFALFVVLSGL
jgi:hypothetical protein